MTTEKLVSAGDESLGASAGASAGTEVTDTSVSAGAEANVEVHANAENEEQVGDVTFTQEAHVEMPK